MKPLIKRIYEDYQKNFGQSKADAWLTSYQGTIQEPLLEPSSEPICNKSTKSLIRPVCRNEKSNAKSADQALDITRRPSLTEALDKQAWREHKQEAFERFGKGTKEHAKRVLKYSNIDTYSAYASRQGRVRDAFCYLVKLVYLVAAFDDKGRFKHLDKCHSVTLFVGMDLLKYAASKDLNMKHTTFWSYLATLRKAGVIDYRGHKTTVAGEVRTDGTLLKVKLQPSPNKVALNNFDFDDANHRDLESDMRNNHTLHQAVNKCEQTLVPIEDKGEHLFLCVSWMLNSSPIFFSQLEELALSVYTDFMDLFESKHPEAILDVMNAYRSKRNHAIQVAAKSLAKLLDDWGSVSFYRRLLWQLLRARDHGFDLFYAVYNLLEGVLIDAREGYKGKTGALFVIRLKKESYYSELWRDQDQWISSPPDTPVIVEGAEHEEDADAIIGELLKN